MWVPFKGFRADGSRTIIEFYLRKLNEMKGSGINHPKMFLFGIRIILG